MIGLVKRRRTQDEQLLSKSGMFAKQDAGVVVRFPASDKRRPDYFVLIEKKDLPRLREICTEVMKNEQA